MKLIVASVFLLLTIATSDCQVAEYSQLATPDRYMNLVVHYDDLLVRKVGSNVSDIETFIRQQVAVAAGILNSATSRTSGGGRPVTVFMPFHVLLVGIHKSQWGDMGKDIDSVFQSFKSKGTTPEGQAILITGIEPSSVQSHFLHHIGRGTVGQVCGGTAVIVSLSSRINLLGVDIAHWLFKFLDAPDDSCNSGCTHWNCCENLSAKCRCVMSTSSGRDSHVVSTGTMDRLRSNIDRNRDKYSCTETKAPESQPICGNGVLESNESCECTSYTREVGDELTNCWGGCSADCKIQGGVGSCPSFEDTTTICRPASGSCDLEELCFQGGCPVNSPAVDGTVCSTESIAEGVCTSGACESSQSPVKEASSSSGSSWWIYVVIAVVAVVVILVIVLLFTLAERRKEPSSRSLSLSRTSRPSPLEPYILSQPTSRGTGRTGKSSRKN